MAFKFPFTNYHELNLTWILDQLKSLFEQSEENVTTIESYENRLTAVETELPTISDTASEASRAAAAAGSLAQTATQKADTAQENAMQAQGMAGTARREAEAAQTAANEATQAAQQAQATAQNFDGRITQAENDASQALEASRSFENRVQSAITTANNAAQTATNAQGIAMRADQNAGAALDKIGDLSQLTTTVKQNLVAAINEVAQTGGSDDCPGYIINTASGAVASFSDGANDRPIIKLVSNIEAAQDLHGHSNPWPAGGGANFLPPAAAGSWTQSGVTLTSDGNGNYTLSGTSTGSASFILNLIEESAIISVGDSIHFRNSTAQGNATVTLMAEGVGLPYYGMNPANRIVTLDSAYDGMKINKIQFYAAGVRTFDVTFAISLEHTNQVTEFTPYSNICPFSGRTSAEIENIGSDNQYSVEISFPSEAEVIYGGNLDVISGKLTASYIKKVINSFSGVFGAVTNGYCAYVNFIDTTHSEVDAVFMKSNIFTYYPENRNTAPLFSYGGIDGMTTTHIFILPASITSLEDANAWLTDNYTECIFKLVTPIEYQFDEHELKTFLGENTISSSAGSIALVEYQADTKLYIDNKIADYNEVIENRLAELQALILEH